MSDEIKNYRVLNQLDDDFVINIRSVYVFSERGKNAFIITNNDEVYSIGNNEDGLLGLGHDKNVRQLQIVTEMSGKEINKFANGHRHAVALSKNGKVYCWGLNNLGQLGNGTRDETEKNVTFHKPILNENLFHKHIVQICCGIDHTMVLTEKGEVFSWGLSANGRLGNSRDYADDYELEPYKVTQFNLEKVQFISCGYAHSMALTLSGHIFCWGWNWHGQLGYESTGNSSKFRNESIPKNIQVDSTNINGTQTSNIINVKKICCGLLHSVLLTTDGHIYFCGSLDTQGEENKVHFTPIEFEATCKFDDIASHITEKILVAISQGICYIYGSFKGEIFRNLKKTEFKSINAIFNHFYEITYEVLSLEVPSPTLISNVSHKKDASYSSNGRYNDEFEALELIGRGSFGKVYKVIKKIDENYYAVKVISFEGFSEEYQHKCLDELKVMAKLSSDHIVQYKSSWIENKKLYIQMELCKFNLSEILFIKRNEFKRNEFDEMNPVEYYISSEIFKELLSSVNYLHKLDPPIIHRDLKPENILLSNGINGKFIKLADFGLVSYHASDNQSHTQDVGTVKYIAPEVAHGRKYDTKADIYSLGVIMHEVFDIDIFSSSRGETNDLLLKDKYTNARNFITEMMTTIKDQRPGCEILLNKENLWTINLEDLRCCTDFEIIKNKFSACHSIDENFCYFFIKSKLSFQ